MIVIKRNKKAVWEVEYEQLFNGEKETRYYKDVRLGSDDLLLFLNDLGGKLANQTVGENCCIDYKILHCRMVTELEEDAG